MWNVCWCVWKHRTVLSPNRRQLSNIILVCFSGAVRIFFYRILWKWRRNPLIWRILPSSRLTGKLCNRIQDLCCCNTKQVSSPMLCWVCSNKIVLGENSKSLGVITLFFVGISWAITLDFFTLSSVPKVKPLSSTKHWLRLFLRLEIMALLQRTSHR